MFVRSLGECKVCLCVSGMLISVLVENIISSSLRHESLQSSVNNPSEGVLLIPSFGYVKVASGLRLIFDANARSQWTLVHQKI